MKFMRRIVLLCFISAVTVLTGCYPLHPSVMLKTGKNFKYSTPPSVRQINYTINPNDLIDFRLYSNDGFKLVDLTSLEGNQNQPVRQIPMDYLVDNEGFTKLPIIGRVNLKGMTLSEAENMLQEKYTLYYNKPFVIIKVSNRRVTVFPGSSGGTARVINLINENTTVIEALAMAGGIQETGRANRIKLIRGDVKNPEVYLIDLSTIEGMKQSDFIVQSNDIIYVEPIPDVTRGLVARISPVVSLLSSALVFYSVIKVITR
jgi:polysaccharide biosynthesis/export protein